MNISMNAQFIRPHHQYAVHSCGLRPVATDVTRSVVCLSVCLHVLGTWVSCTKTAEPIEMTFGG